MAIALFNRVTKKPTGLVIEAPDNEGYLYEDAAIGAVIVPSGTTAETLSGLYVRDGRLTSIILE